PGRPTAWKRSSACWTTRSADVVPARPRIVQRDGATRVPTERPMPDDNPLTRFFGGPPLSVIFRLILLSILIGVILEGVGPRPWTLSESRTALVLRIGDRGLAGARWLWRSRLPAAAGVAPLWLRVRLVRPAKGGGASDEPSPPRLMANRAPPPPAVT